MLTYYNCNHNHHQTDQDHHAATVVVHSAVINATCVGLVKENEHPYTSCIDCCIRHSNGARADRAVVH